MTTETNRIYLDNNATTLVDPSVAEVVMAELTGFPSNPSGVHWFGQQARNRLVRARRFLADYFGVAPRELIFTSGGTEALNMVLRGVCPPGGKGHIITTVLEHVAVRNTIQELERGGYSVTCLLSDESGAVQAAAVEAALRADTCCIAVMAVNNETGVRNPIEAIAEVAHQRGIPFVVDGVAWLGKDSFSLPEGVTAVAFSGHKIHAPKGVGLLLLRQRQRVVPLLTGGSQEYGRRAGTENLGGILGLVRAVECIEIAGEAAITRMASMRDAFEKYILERVPDTVVNGLGPRVANTSNISFVGLDVEALMMSLDMAGLAVSHGSACSSGSLEPSRVVEGMGLGRARAMTSLRFSLSRLSREEELQRAAELVVTHANRMHSLGG